QIAFEPEALQLSLKADHSLELIKMIAQAKNIKLENNINSNIYVLADKNMLKTVFRNLITNAIKFSNRNSKVTINAKLIENNVEISIMDQGIGMNNNTLDNLFKVGIKTTRPGTSNEKGSGLGLILCKDFIEKNAGKIWAESEENKGSIFYFSLPLAHKE
ncbi:MAG: sensor histidine kinase, partial [Bacteroidia bacterium]